MFFTNGLSLFDFQIRFHPVDPSAGATMAQVGLLMNSRPLAREHGKTLHLLSGKWILDSTSRKRRFNQRIIQKAGNIYRHDCNSKYLHNAATSKTSRRQLSAPQR
jgi:hypothetical protein